MAFPSTYSDGNFVLLDFDYPYKSLWLDGRGLPRSDTVFSFDEYQKYKELAFRILTSKGIPFNSATEGLRPGYVPLLAKGVLLPLKVWQKKELT